MRRVLAPGKSVVLTVWSAVSPLFAAIAEACDRYIGPEASTSALSPFAYRDIKVIKALLLEAGFPEVKVDPLAVERRIGPAKEAIPKKIAGAPVGTLMAKLDGPTQKPLYDDIEEALSGYVVNGGIVVPQEAHLIQATKP